MSFIFELGMITPRIYTLPLLFTILGILHGTVASNVFQNNQTIPANRGQIPSAMTPIQPTVECHSHNIEISIPTNLVRSSLSAKILPPNYVIFRSDASEHCRAETGSEGTYLIKINLKSQFLCGSTIEEKDYQTEYRNEVVVLDAEAGVIWSLLNITCVYQDEDRVIILPKSSRKLVLPHASIEMSLYRDKSFSDDSYIATEMPEISVGHFLFVSIDLVPQDGQLDELEHMRVVSRNCFASYYPSARDERMFHKFIANGCADKLDSTVAIQSNGGGWSSRWKFQMFKWVNTTVQRIYLFCEVKLCDETKLTTAQYCDMNKTKENCFGQTYGRRNRRDLVAVRRSDLGNRNTTNIVSIGPIFPKDSVYLLDIPKGGKPGSFGDGPADSEANNGEVIPVAVGVVLGVCVVILLIAGYLTWNRHVAQKNARRENAKKKIQQGFAFVMKSSNDPDIFHSLTDDKTTNPNGEIGPNFGSEISVRMNSQRRRKKRSSSVGSLSPTRSSMPENRIQRSEAIETERAAENRDENRKPCLKCERRKERSRSVDSSRMRRPNGRGRSGAVSGCRSDSIQRERKLHRDTKHSRKLYTDCPELAKTRTSRERDASRSSRSRSRHRTDNSKRTRHGSLETNETCYHISRSPRPEPRRNRNE